MRAAVLVAVTSVTSGCYLTTTVGPTLEGGLELTTGVGAVAHFDETSMSPLEGKNRVSFGGGYQAVLDDDGEMVAVTANLEVAHNLWSRGSRNGPLLRAQAAAGVGGGSFTVRDHQGLPRRSDEARVWTASSGLELAYHFDGDDADAMSVGLGVGLRYSSVDAGHFGRRDTAAPYVSLSLAGPCVAQVLLSMGSSRACR